MADPIKPMDRMRPFKRINNEAAIPANKPDGLGIACGCHTPKDLPNLDAEFRKFLENRQDALGKIFQALEVAKKAAAGAKEVSDIAKKLAAAAALVPVALLGPLGASGIGTVVAALTSVANAINVVSSFVDGLLKAVDTGLKEFMVRLGAALARRAIRRVPQWVPVEDADNRQKITTKQIREVEGIVARSYCDPLGTPFFQWQNWLSWSIQVRPEGAYKNLVVDGFAFSTDKVAGSPLVDPSTVELQWDMGALNVGGAGPGVYQNALQGKKTEDGLTSREAPFFQSTRIFSDTENNWLWPTAGMFVWASGRWVYDCSRPDKVDPKKGEQPKMYAMLNPVRALATASWEAFGFKENTAPKSRPIRNAVPAIRFMFIASRHGGHLTYDSLAEEDYEFILDLPPMPVPPSPFPIGHTNAHKRDGELPDFPHNTIVLRPKLLRDLRKPAGNVKLVNPIIELLPSAKGPGIVEQVKITVKAGDLVGTGSGHAGFLLSLGWFDPNIERARTAKSAAVSITAMRGRLEQDRDTPVETLRKLFAPELADIKKTITDEIAKIKLPILPPPAPAVTIDDMVNNKLPEPLHTLVASVGKEVKQLALTLVDKIFEGLLDALAGGVGALSTEECMFHFGVNGRWTSRFLDLERNQRQAFSSPVEVEVVLGPDDALYYASSGVEWNPVGDIMFAGHADRLLKRGGEAVVWSQIAKASGDELRDLVFEYVLQILKGGPGVSLGLGIENDPIGVKQPKALDQPDGINPISMEITAPADVAIDTKAATFAHAEGQESVLSVEVAGKKDYVLEGTVHVAPQFPK